MAKVVQVKGLDAAKEVFAEPDKWARARRSAINIMTDRSKTTASQKIRDSYVILKRDLDPKLVVSKLSVLTGGGNASFAAGKKGFPLAAFGTPSWRRTWPGAKVTIRRGFRVTIHHSFIPTVSTSGGLLGSRTVLKNLAGDHIFTRRTAQTKRLPIDKMYSIDPGGMFDQDRVYDKIQDRVDAEFDNLVQDRIRFYVGG